MTARNYAMLTTPDSVKALADKLLAEQKPIGFDIETGYHGPNRDKGSLFIDWNGQFPCGFSITNDLGWARYVPTAHDNGQNVPDGWEIIKPVLETLPTTAHNMKFESRNLRALERKNIGPNINIKIGADSALQSYVLSMYETNHGLKHLTELVFGHKQAEIESLFPNAAKKDLDALRFNVLETTPEVIAYACEDAVWTLGLDGFFLPQIKANPRRSFVYDIEMRILELLCDMEDAGHAVDWSALEHQREYAEPFWEEMVQAARRGLSEMANQDLSTLNLGSAKQMREVLYGTLGLNTTRRTKGGELSTDATALEGLSRNHVPVKKVLESREVKNLAGRLKKWADEYSISHDRRVHANFNQVIVGSGRFSANDPSIQQLPKGWGWHTLNTDQIDLRNPNHVGELHKRAIYGKHFWTGNFRDFLVAAPGCYLLGFDWSQIELRVLAGFSQEPALLEAFATGKDVHTMTASQMLHVDFEKVQDHQRSKGKTLNFGLVYQMGVGLLAEQLAITEAEAQELYDAYFRAFNKVGLWFAEAKELGRMNGYIETYFGRKWTLWELQSANWAIVSKGERLCVNAPCQGTAADYAKISMLKCKKALEDRGWWMTKVRMINNLHDALTFEADNDIDPNELRDLLEPCVTWEIPELTGMSVWGPRKFPKMAVDWEIGQKWGSSAKWKGHKKAAFDGEHWVVQSDSEPPAAPVEAPSPEEGMDVVAPIEEDEVPRPLTVELADMPDRESFGRFLGFLSDRPGTTVVTIKTPEGEVDLENYPTSVGVGERDEISFLLGGARVYVPKDVSIEDFKEIEL